MPALTVQEAERLRGSVMADRSTWEPSWREIRDYMLPYYGRFPEDQPNRGDRRDSKILQNAAKMAIRTLSAGLLTGLTSPSRPWFRLGMADPDMNEFATVRRWLDEVEKRMYAVFSSSNTYTALHSIYYELAGFGTSCAFIHEDYEDVIRMRVYTIGEYALGQDHRLQPDTVSRDVYMTAHQMVREFGEKNCSDNVRSRENNNRGHEWFPVRHLLLPNPEAQPGRRDYRGKPFLSVYWEPGQEKFLRQEGYEEFPAVCPRWELISGDVYGKSPGWDTIGDAKMLQDMRGDSLEALDKLIDPPMAAPHSMRNEYLDLTPGGVSYLGAQEMQAGLRPLYQVNPDLVAIEQNIMALTDRINKAFYVDMFLMLSQVADKQKTAYEVAELTREKMLMLGPAIEQQEHSLLKPLIERTFSIMERGGLIPLPPREVQGEALQVEYVSILAQAQKAVATTSIREWATVVASLGQMFPDILAKVNAPELADQYGELLGVPSKIIRSDEEVEEITRAQQQQQQVQQGIAAAQSGAQMAKDLSQAQVGNKNALEAMFGEAAV